MNFQDITALIQTVSILLGIWVAAGTVKGRKADEVASLTEMKTDIKYIKETLDGMNGLPDRVARVEESAKSAHKRLDEHIKQDH